jgi:hypothetical protein
MSLASLWRLVVPNIALRIKRKTFNGTLTATSLGIQFHEIEVGPNDTIFFEQKHPLHFDNAAIKLAIFSDTTKPTQNRIFHLVTNGKWTVKGEVVSNLQFKQVTPIHSGAWNVTKMDTVTSLLEFSTKLKTQYVRFIPLEPPPFCKLSKQIHHIECISVGFYRHHSQCTSHQHRMPLSPPSSPGPWSTSQ